MKAYPPDSRLYVCTVLEEYSKNLSLGSYSEVKLLITYVGPFKAATHDTVEGWIKVVILKSGIHMNVFGPLSVCFEGKENICAS